MRQAPCVASSRLMAGGSFQCAAGPGCTAAASRCGLERVVEAPGRRMVPLSAWKERRQSLACELWLRRLRQSGKFSLSERNAPFDGKSVAAIPAASG